MTKQKQFIALVALSCLVAVESYYLTAVKSESKPAAVFNRPTREANFDRTLRPEGQTEEAALCTEFTFRRELGDLCPELWQPVFSVDRQYISPTEQTARLILKRAFRKLEDVYVPEAYDCDDNATELMVLLRKEALVEFREYPAALAIGWVGVRIDGPIQEYRGMTREPREYPMYHAMVIMRVKGNHWFLIEPLSHQVCELTGRIFEGAVTIHILYF